MATGPWNHEGPCRPRIQVTMHTCPGTSPCHAEGRVLSYHPSIHPSIMVCWWLLVHMCPETFNRKKLNPYLSSINVSIHPSIHPSILPSFLPSFPHGAPRWLLPKTCPETLTYKMKVPHFSSINFIHPSWCAGVYWFQWVLHASHP